MSGDDDHRKSGQGQSETVTRGVTHSVSVSQGEGWSQEGTSEGTSWGESESISRHQTLWGEPEAMERMARQQHYKELCEQLSGSWMLPPDRLSPAEQELLREELRRLALDSAQPGRVAAYACAAAGEVQLALQVPTDRLSEVVQLLLRSRLARLA